MGHSSHVYVYEYKTGMLIFGRFSFFYSFIILPSLYFPLIRGKKNFHLVEDERIRVATGHLVFINKIILEKISLWSKDNLAAIISMEDNFIIIMYFI